MNKYFETKMKFGVYEILGWLIGNFTYELGKTSMRQWFCSQIWKEQEIVMRMSRRAFLAERTAGAKAWKYEYA